MNRTLFEKPIDVLVGLGFVKRLITLEEAYGFLVDWRGLKSSQQAHSVAINAVRSALSGEIEPATARSFVEAFARRAGVLAPNMGSVIADVALAKKSDQTAH